jgi:hypothetical protein
MTRSEELDICDNCEHMEFAGRYQLPFCDHHKNLINYIDKCEKWNDTKKCICQGFYKPNHCPVHGR